MNNEQPPLTFQQKLALIRSGDMPKTTAAKPKKAIPKVSAKTAAKNKEAKEVGSDGEMDRFFVAMRKKMVNVCQCGCGRKSSMMEDDHYRASICHVFPKRIFKSIARHELNWVERNFWDGCHSNMDNRSMDLWVNFADWEDIKERFHSLAPLLTDEERASKFYQHFEKLIYEKK